MNPNHRHLNPAAGNFKPTNMNNMHRKQNKTPLNMTPSPATYLEARVLSLEEEYANLRGEVGTLKEKYHQLCRSVEKGKEAAVVEVQPLADVKLDPPHKTIVKLGQELEELTLKTRALTNSEPVQKPVQSSHPKVGHSTPPHLRAASTASDRLGSKLIPPHLRKATKSDSKIVDNTPSNYLSDSTKDKYEPLVTDGPIDTFVGKPEPITAQLTPPATPPSSTKPRQNENTSANVGIAAAKDWKPHYLTTLSKLPSDVLSKIPSQQSMVTFSPDFLSNVLGGEMWSPGLKFVKPTGPCILKNRTYYTLDATNEPYLPKAAGEHGAKLTAFFNSSPEEDYPELQIKSYEDVPMFVECRDPNGRIRYTYFGNYSQTRWSDKLDNDTMRARVPQQVKEHWARELTATPREQWVTNALKKHFFPKPEYGGRLYVPPNEDDDESVHSVEERKNCEKMAKDVKDYVEELKNWEREASMKTSMIKKQFILDAFDTADVDDPPALRLWWEYLECVGWKKDLYDMLVSLQSRDQQYA